MSSSSRYTARRMGAVLLAVPLVLGSGLGAQAAGAQGSGDSGSSAVLVYKGNGKNKGGKPSGSNPGRGNADPQGGWEKVCEFFRMPKCSDK
ncbi:MAG: hypothetical protein Q4G51_08105 [Dermatophilus congolensis]|nr:hypothetical protein [Dermatophilus congolensis]